MSDAEIGAALRAWRAEPSEDGLAEVVRLHERVGVELPWDVVAGLPRWVRFVGFVRKWFSRPLDEASGNTLAELAAAEARLGFALPAAVRELYRLAGRRPDLLEPTRALLALERVPQKQVTLAPRVLLLASRFGQHRLVDVADSPDSPDPPVRFVLDGVEERVIPSVSEYALAHLVQRRATSWDYADGVRVRSAYPLSAEERRAIETRYTELPVPALRDLQVFGDADTLIQLASHPRAVAATRTPEALAVTESWQTQRWANLPPKRRITLREEFRDIDPPFATTHGGPVLLLPQTTLPRWWGVCNADGEAVFDVEPTDYDRACADGPFPFPIELRSLGLAPASGWALVLETPDPCAFLHRAGSLLVVRWSGADSAQGLFTLAASLREADWDLDLLEVEVPAGGLVLIDSSEDGRDPTGDNGIATTELAPGRYAVDRVVSVSATVVDGAAEEEVMSQLVRLRPLPPA